MQQAVHNILGSYSDICICGDGRNNSPGHGALYCVYTLMEHVTNVVVDLEILDKRDWRKLYGHGERRTEAISRVPDD